MSKRGKVREKGITSKKLYVIEDILVPVRFVCKCVEAY